MVVTQFRPHGEGFPIAILLHGRSYKDRSKPGRERFCRPRNILSEVLPFGYRHVLDMVSQELSLILNTRLVRVKIYPYEVAASSTLDVIAYAKQQSYVDPARIVVLGQSYVVRPLSRSLRRIHQV
jgi:hypothetical protein